MPAPVFFWSIHNLSSKSFTFPVKAQSPDLQDFVKPGSIPILIGEFPIHATIKLVKLVKHDRYFPLMPP